MHSRGQACHLDHGAQRDFTPLPALAIVTHRAGQQLRRARRSLLQIRDLIELLAQHLRVAFAPFAQRLHQFFVLDQLFFERNQSGVNRFLSRLKILLREFALPLELFLRALHQAVFAHLEHIAARGFERFDERGFRLIHRATQLFDGTLALRQLLLHRIAALMDARFDRAKFLREQSAGA